MRTLQRRLVRVAAAAVAVVGWGIGAKTIGVIMMVFSFFQWMTFDYPDTNPFWHGAIWQMGIETETINLIFISLLSVVGYGLFTLGKFGLDKFSKN